MITPSPTTKIDPSHARGVLEEIVAPTATKPGYIVLGVPNTNYRLQLRCSQTLDASGIGKRLIGLITAEARRIDVVQTGGRFIEPVFGRPRRVQGSVVAADAANNTITVNAGVPITVAISDRRQKADQFVPGQVVSFDVLDGATIAPV